MPKGLNITAITLSFLGYISIAFLIERHQHEYLIPAYLLIFIAYLFLLKNIYSLKLRHIIFLGILFRLIFLISFPSLSDDYFRFIWDGRLLAEGYNPYEHLPSYFVGENALSFLDPDLFYQLNSPEYHSVYPPVPQFVFMVAAALFPDSIYASVLTMKFFALAGEIGLFYVMFRILRRLQLHFHYMAIYVFNPLVIIEVMGNLHHEGLMLFFLLLGIYLCLKNKYIRSAIIWGLSVATKLIPLMFLPLLINRLDRRSLIHFGLIFTSTVVILFIPLIDGLVQGMGDSISLYYTKFEFNPGIYYIIREIGFQVKGYNVIQTAGPYLGITVFILVMAYSLYTKKDVPWFDAMTWIVVVFLLFSTTVHPWYIVGLICFSVFTGYLFPIVWSLLIFLTYIGYTPTGYEEYGWILLLEYLPVVTLMVYETIKKEHRILHHSINPHAVIIPF